MVGSAPDPFIARDKIRKLEPHVLTTDVEMPRMDGLTFLGKLMAARPTPVVMVSSLTQARAETTLAALEIEAVDFAGKPNGALEGSLEKLEVEHIEKVRAVASTKFFSRNISSRPIPPSTPFPKLRKISFPSEV
ncbi:MAG: response regulator [Nitrospinota bacterium]|nr:response regulator [Nitrospinota bacterium]